MAATAFNYNERLDPILNSNETRTRFWGLILESGKLYDQLVIKKFCITHAVLDPSSFLKDDHHKFVSVIVIHNKHEHIMAVFKHGEIHQVSLNMLFDKENVTFRVEGFGKVHLLGYEVFNPNYEETASLPESPLLGVQASSMLKSEGFSEQENLKMERIGMKRKVSKQDLVEQRAARKYAKKLLNVELESSSDEDEDADFSAGDEGSEEEEEEEVGSEDEIGSEELEKITADLEADEDKEEMPQPVQKRKRYAEQEKPQKHSKAETSPKAGSIKKSKDRPFIESSSDLSSDVVPAKKKGKKKNKVDLMDPSHKLDKAQQTKSPSSTIKLKGGVEIMDLKIGHGPVALKGKLLHVFYMGRLFNKHIFDSILPGKKPFSFRLGCKQVLKGWDIGLEGMKAGGKRKIIVPPNMGYGNRSVEGIPPNSTLYFTVDLQAVSS